MNRHLRLLPLFALISTNAFAFDITALGGLNFSSPSYENSSVQNVKAKGKASYGLLLNFNMLPMIWVETGVMQIGRKYEYFNTNGAVAVSRTNSALEIPLLIRVHLPFVSAGLGGYYQKVDRDLDVVQAGVTGTTFDAASAPNDYGLKGSLRGSLPIFPMVSLIAEGQYVLGLKDRSNHPVVVDKNRELRALAGVTVSL